jgi:hypothetical protein
LAARIMSDLPSYGDTARKYIHEENLSHGARPCYLPGAATPGNDRCELHLLPAFDTILGFVCQGSMQPVARTKNRRWK